MRGGVFILLTHEGENVHGEIVACKPSCLRGQCPGVYIAVIYPGVLIIHVTIALAFICSETKKKLVCDRHTNRAIDILAIVVTDIDSNVSGEFFRRFLSGHYQGTTGGILTEQGSLRST